MNTLFGQHRRPYSAFVILGLAALSIIVGMKPASAQISTGEETRTRPVKVDKSGRIQIPAAETFIGISPLLTSFQQQYSIRQGSGDPHPGEVDTKHTTHLGPTALVEKLYFLSPVQGAKSKVYSTFSLGAWYWYSTFNKLSGTGLDNDRYALYTKYFYNNRIGAQASAGGGTRSGFYEYYIFGLYNLTNGSPTHPLGVQLGFGPYFPRSSYGDTGYTGVVNFSLAPPKDTDRLSYSASVWYVNFQQPIAGASFKKANTTLRLNFSINYKL